jgi:hypothetical protein
LEARAGETQARARGKQTGPATCRKRAAVGQAPQPLPHSPKAPCFSLPPHQGGPAGGVWARGHWWPSPTATCPRLRPGPVPHVSSLPPQERYGAGELLFLACRDDLPALLLSAPVVWFEFDAVVVLRVIGGLRFGSAGSGVGEKTAAKLLGPFGTGR